MCEDDDNLLTAAVEKLDLEALVKYLTSLLQGPARILPMPLVIYPNQRPVRILLQLVKMVMENPALQLEKKL